jgi:mannose-6-phosphate isomerase
MTDLPPLQLIPEYRDYVWGGQRLRPDFPITAEAWVVYEKDRISGGVYDGQTLGELASQFGVRLLGRHAYERTGDRFPVLIKLLDCAAWLSLQVHPDDEQARQLEGEHEFGKTEAWHILDAQPVAQLIAGFLPGVSPDQALQAIRLAGENDPQIVNLLQYIPVQAGDTVFMRAGTVHALGPGLFVYEIQETSDWTYRVYDWGRPQVKGRVLHTEKSIAVTNPAYQGQAVPLRTGAGRYRQVLAECEYFQLERMGLLPGSLALQPQGESFHALTVIAGSVELISENTRLSLKPYETVLVPAATAAYTLVSECGCQLLLATA